MNKQVMIDKIYEAIADKTLREGSNTDQGLYVGDRLDIITCSCISGYRDIDEGCGCCSSPRNYETLTGIKNPVMIGDVLDWMDDKNIDTKYIDGIEGDDCGNLFESNRPYIMDIWKEKRKPLENQSEDCILFVYNLIND